MKQHEIKMKCGTLWVEDGVMRLLLSKSEHTLEDSKENIDNIEKLVSLLNLEKKVLLVDYGPCTKQTIDSRKFYSTDPKAKAVADKIALLVKSPVTKVIANFFMGINAPHMPCRIFTDEDEALKWLKS